MVHQDDATKGFRAVFYGFGAFYYLDIGVAVLVYFGCVVGSPLLSGEPGTIAHEQYSVAIHAVDDRLGYGGAGLYGAHAADIFEQCGQRFAHGAGDGRATDLLLHVVGAKGRMFARDDNFLNRK